MTMDPDDDDHLREVLQRDTPPPQAAAVLRQLQPALRRSRSHRRVARGTAVALLAVSGGAAVLAVDASLPGPERRASTVLPPVTHPNVDESTSTAVVPTDRLAPAPAATESPDEPTSSIQPATPSPEVGTLPVETTRPSPSVTPSPAPGAAVAQPVPTAAPPTPPAPIEEVTVAPSPAPPAPSTRTVNSECGAVVIGIDGQRIHVDSIAPSPGFGPQISTDGPETVELVLVSSAEKCEIHVESAADGLHVEVQDDS
jgi:cytoskeletal protein RodZ